MKVYAPSFYNDFKCKTSACSRTCCAGWEIDIDDESLSKYKALEGSLGDELRSKIDESGDTPCFRLVEDDRCPFLTKDNLCKLILETGSEDILCQICTDHPRFRNFWTDRIEVGLGLACEEAARLVLSQKESLSLIVIEDDGDDIELPEDEEYLMDVRNNLWDAIAQKEFPTTMHRRLAEYLVYRHIADALYDDRLDERIEMVEEYYQDCIKRLENPSNPSLEEFILACVDFSIEIEYKA